MSIEFKKEDIIHHGLDIFRLIGAHHVCNVCIKSGESCCFLCDHLEDGVGCQRRNTSCTAWLCGIQSYLFEEIELLDEWNQFWSVIPGQMFRRDHTPDKVWIKSFINTENLTSHAGELLAERLSLYVQEGGDLGKLERKLDKKYAKDPR